MMSVCVCVLLCEYAVYVCVCVRACLKLLHSLLLDAQTSETLGLQEHVNETAHTIWKSARIYASTLHLKG